MKFLMEIRNNRLAFEKKRKKLFRKVHKMALRQIKSASLELNGPGVNFRLDYVLDVMHKCMSFTNQYAYMRFLKRFLRRENFSTSKIHYIKEDNCDYFLIAISWDEKNKSEEWLNKTVEKLYCNYEFSLGKNSHACNVRFKLPKPPKK